MSIERVQADKPAAMSDPQLARWIRSVWHTKKISRIEVHHVTTGGRDHLQTWQASDLAGKEIEPLTQEIWDAAAHDAHSFKGVQAYCLFIFEESRPQPMRRMFRMQGTEWEEDNGELESEPANARGHLAQLMRHNEAYARLAIGGSREAQSVLKGMLSDVLQQNREMMALQMRVMDSYKELQDRTFEREMDREDKKTVREIKSMVAGEATKLLPILLTKFATGDDEKKGAEDQIRMLLMQFAGSLNAQQMEAILGPLSEQQRLVFMALYQKLQEQYQQSAEGQREAQAQAQAEAEARAQAEAEAQAQAEEKLRREAETYAAIAAQVEAARSNPEPIAPEPPPEVRVLDAGQAAAADASSTPPIEGEIE